MGGNHGRPRINILPTTSIDVMAVLRDSPCPASRLALRVHFVEADARTALRPMQPSTTVGPWTQPQLAYVIRAAVAAKNMSVISRKDLQHAHVIFLRLKSNGLEYRMLVDASDRGHPNAYNSRLPKPPKPPAMLPVLMVIIIINQGDVMAVDDIATAFHQLSPMTHSMSAALGVAVPLASGNSLCAKYLAVPQGGTWSAVTMQGVSLMAAHAFDGLPNRKAEASRPRDDWHNTPPADWATCAIKKGRITHVDDIVSTAKGEPAALDKQRLEMKELATKKYNVKWKPSLPSASTGVALGINYDLSEKVWSVTTKWSQAFTKYLRRETVDTEKVRGCVVWIATVFALPAIIVPSMSKVVNIPDSTRRMLQILASSRATWVSHDAPTIQQLSRPVGYDFISITDAMGYGWAGATNTGLSEAGKWYRCKSAGIMSPVPCCGGTETIYVPPEDMYLGESMASAWMALRSARRQGVWRKAAPEPFIGRELLMITDSDVWNKAVRRGYSSNITLLSLMLLLHLALPRAPAIAHVKGDDNPADKPSRNQTTFEFTHIPPHTRPVRSTLALSKICGATEQLMLDTTVLPCAFEDMKSLLRGSREGHHVTGCACGGL